MGDAMTRKDFQELAAAIAVAERAANTETARKVIAERLAHYCATKNASFDRVRFLQACGVNP